MSIDKILDSKRPNSFEAEELLLSAVIQKPKSVEQFYSFLKPEMFYTPAHSVLFKTLMKMYNDGTPIDFIEVSEQLQKSGELEAIGGRKKIAIVLERYLGYEEVLPKALMIYEFYLKRQAMDIGGQLIIRASDYSYGIKTIANEFLNKSVELDAQLNIADNRTEDEVIEKAYNETLDIITGKTPRIDSPFIDVNKDSFYLLGEVFTIAARPRMGKTAIALAYAEHWAKNYKVYFISLEMSESSLIMRRMSYYSGESMYDLHHSVKALDRGRKALNDNTNGNIIIDDSADTNTSNLAGKVRQAVEKGCKIVILDYIQLLESEGKDEVAKITHSTRLVQKIAKKYNVLFVQLAQLNRGSEGSDPKMQDAKGSGAIEEVSNHMSLLTRPEEHDKNTQITVKGSLVSPQGIAKFINVKNRTGASNKVCWLTFEKEAMKFSNYSSLTQWDVRGNQIHIN